MNDYVITFDTNCQPYIAHAFWERNKGGQKKEHKYYEKIKNGLKTRYFYSKAEWDAYQNGNNTNDTARSSTKVSYSNKRGLEKVKESISEKWNGGVTAKKAEEAHAKYTQAHRDLAQTKKVVNEQEKARKKNIVKAVKDTFNNIPYEEYKALDKAQDKADGLQKYDEYMQMQARKAYQKSIVGKIVEGSAELLFETIPDNSKWFNNYLENQVATGNSILSKPLTSLAYTYEANFDPYAYNDNEYMSEMQLYKRRGYVEKRKK